MFALHCSLVSLAPVFSPSFSFGSSLSPASSLLAPPLLPKNSFRLGNPCDASSYSDQNRNGSRIRNPSLAYTAREGLDSIAGDGEVEGDVRSPGTAKGSGTTARGRRLLKVREEKRRREYDRLHNYPTWAKILENACRDDAELRAVLGDSIGNPELMRKRVEERIRKKGGDFRKSKTGSVLAFKVNFRE
ncbi:hypothetical protein ZIOFF_053436 [Zingiber officinale]|uniref:Uncharacterized protein n=1 Tax=Zingiber officinale TaxID=94328 RepID=A0A8J5KLW4_ZINOF|nr:hypothetical protein ZIOFF_053436 [Zingiber officinale]